jgi:hypothetical protein
MELFLAVIALYAGWSLVPRRAQQGALTWFWASVLLMAAIGLAWSLMTTGTIGVPAVTWFLLRSWNG